MENENFKFSELTSKIIKAYFKVYNTLGYGFLERNYENALLIELGEMGLKAVKQVPIKVYYANRVVGNYFADIVVEDKVIIEIKANESLSVPHEMQLVNYLRATDKEVGLILNFGTEPAFRRKVLNNHLKPDFALRYSQS